MKAPKAVFLDRDGVINRTDVRNGKPYAPRAVEHFDILPGVKEACTALADGGFLLFVVTNQPDIGNGLVDPKIVEQMNDIVRQDLPITAIYVCPHAQTEGCACRKPKPGMLLKAKEEFGISMAGSYMVGDRHGDVLAGISAGVTPVFIDHEYVETPPMPDIIRARDLLEASRIILNKGRDDDRYQHTGR